MQIYLSGAFGGVTLTKNKMQDTLVCIMQFVYNGENGGSKPPPYHGRRKSYEARGLY